MKTRIGFTRHLAICFIAVGVALTARSVRAGFIETFDLVLTENSSTSLSLSYNGPSGNSGFTVANTSADHWTVTINSAEINFAPFIYEWTEPEEPNEVNKVVYNPSTNPFAFFVTSDLPLLLDGDAAPQNDNTRSSAPIGFDVDQSGLVFLTFHDLAATGEVGGSTVPDTGSTLGLFAVSCVLLFGAVRVRSARLA